MEKNTGKEGGGGGAWRGGGPKRRETESIITLADHQELEKKKKTKEWEREKKVHGQIHLPLLQSISGQKKYTITRQEEAKINGPPTSPLTSIHLYPIPPLSLSFFSLSPSLTPFLFLPSHFSSSYARKKPPLYFLRILPPAFLPSPRHTHTHTLSLPHAVIYSFC